MWLPKKIDSLPLAQLLQLRTDLKLALSKLEIIIRAREARDHSPAVVEFVAKEISR
jgi:hypothetical protein